MKKKILSLLVTMGLAASLVPVSVFADGTEVWDGSVAESFAGGKGTKDDPYQIATGSQLAYFAKRVNAEEYGEKYADTYFELTEDIDLGGKEWTPVGETVADLIMGGHEYFVFSGNFDGNGYTIKNLTIGTETSPYSGDVCGLFGATSGTIEDVVLENVSINYVGGNHSSGYGFRMGGALVGYSMGDIVNCTVIGLDMKAGSDGSYVALNSIGGLVGIQDGGTTVSHSRVSGKIEESTKKGNVGGFVGTLAKGSSAKYCGADVSVEVTGSGRGIAVGGFVGIGNGVTTDETLIENCYATGNITGAEYAGGFVGNISGLNISNCYAKGNVSNGFVGASFMGTDAASNDYYGTVKNCYATGLVSDISSFAYAFAMQDTMKRSTIQNCYYNIQNSAKNTESAASLTIDDMKTDSFLNVLNGSSNVWTKRDNDTPACGAEPADYSNVYEVLGNIPADLSIYTDESVANLYSAVEALRGYRDLAQQSDVDKMTNDINDAVEALVYKSADYTELDKAEEAAKALNKDDYEDFSEVEKALAAIDRTKNITEQADVDAMVKAINDAVANLVKKAPASSQPDSVSSSDASSDTSSSASDSSSSDSKSDSSSKAASNASNTNPSTGVAGGAFALALLSGAAVVMAKRKK
ncbi:GLUG motif-containing protein [Ruminococcus bicirculans (ex Wegman et al. 2014)]|uniref:GLUG motif-containing protein n=2 Tax=Ruminococcus bicirculans (ex Wegman et al. 2014) TaxID=1160721 RepID=UPI00241C2539|nr:GLUG motif-containing protein [Ruminococcus bicirculans (ex Wegman et al. 2014)]